MEYLLLGVVIIVSVTISTLINFYISKKHILKVSKLFSSYRTEMFRFSETQKQNTEKLVELLNKLFVSSDTQVKPEANEVTQVNKDEIEFTEQNPINLPNDVKFEVEGGDNFIPPGYQQQSN